MRLKYPEIPNIEKLSEETKNIRNRIKQEALKILLDKSTPFFDEILIQIELAKGFGFNVCSIKCEDLEVVDEIKKKYIEAKYEVKYERPVLHIGWPS